MFLILQYSTLKSTEYSTPAGTWELAWSKEARRVTDWVGEEEGDGRTEGSAAIGDGGQAAVSLSFDVGGASSGSLLDSTLSSWKNHPVISGY